jgi:hypothetical protein
MIGLGQAANTCGDLACQEYKSAGLTDCLTGTDESTERSNGSNSIETGRQCSQQFHRPQLDLTDRVMHLNRTNTSTAVTAWRSDWQAGRWCQFCGNVQLLSNSVLGTPHSERYQVRTTAPTPQFLWFSSVTTHECRLRNVLKLFGLLNVLLFFSLIISVFNNFYYWLINYLLIWSVYFSRYTQIIN